MLGTSIRACHTSVLRAFGSRPRPVGFPPRLTMTIDQRTTVSFAEKWGGWTGRANWQPLASVRGLLTGAAQAERNSRW